MTSVIGLRYPKSHSLGQLSTIGAADNWILSHRVTLAQSTTVAVAEPVACIPIACARYSEVRKVVFWVTVRKPSASPHAAYPAKLKMAHVSSSASASVAQPITFAPGSYHRVAGGGTSFTNTVFHSSHMFARDGDTSTGNLPVNADQDQGPTVMLKIEFNRFDPTDTDFFAIWDSVASTNAYIFFRPLLQRTTGVFTSNVTVELNIHNIGISIVQAPAGINRTCTYIKANQDIIAPSVMSATYGINNRPFIWRYFEANWDNITAVHLFGHVFWANGIARSWRQSIHKLTASTPITFSLLTDELVTDPLATPGVGDGAWYRTTDLKAALVGQDGALLLSLFDNQAGNNTLPHCWFEIIQENFTKTQCVHASGSGHRLNGLSGANDFGSPETGLFDPTWYQGIPDANILDRKIFAGNRHDGVLTNVEMGLHLDTNLQSDHSRLAETSATLIQVTPTLSATPTATAGYKLILNSSFSPDPIDLAGQRKLVFGIFVTGDANDFPGDCGIYYVLSVPNTEFLPLGDVFEVGAFDPEGCAATSAGLGDPGKLYISNGSTIPKKFDPDQGNITNAGMPTPFPDEIPSYVVTTTALSPEGGLSNGTYIYRYTIRDCCTGKESDPNPDDIEVTISGAVPAGLVTFSFANVRVPSDNLCEICLYRTVVGGVFPILAKVGCFDPNVTETFADDLADSELDFIEHPLSILNAPFPCVPYIVAFRNRIFGAGDIPIHSPAGTVSVVLGSNIIEGSDDVEWDRCLEGRFIMIAGECNRYEIERVLPPDLGTSPPIRRLQLATEYEGASQTEASYEICGHPNRLYFSEPLEGEFWPLPNFLDIEPGDGDRIMGLATNFDRLIIYKRRKTYVLTFGDTPHEVNVPARISSDIGLVAPRSPAQIENGTVGLAERGLQIFDGRGVQHVAESSLINDLFVDPANTRYVRRDDLGRVIDAVGAFYPKREQYLLLVPTVQTIRGCNLMVVWDTKLRNVTFFEFCQEFQSMVVGKNEAGDETVYLGDTNGFVWAFDVGHNDGAGVPGASGTLRGTFTGGGVDGGGTSFFDDSTATFLEGGVPGPGVLSGIAGLSGSLGGSNLGLAGVCVHYRAPDESVWSHTFIFAATPTRLYITSDLDFDPTGYEYMIGAIKFEAVFKPFNYGSDDYTKRLWKQKIVHEIEEFSSELEIEVRVDFSDQDQFAGDVVNQDLSVGRKFKMSWAFGKQIGGIERIPHTYLQIVFKNFAPDEPIRIINHVIQGTPQESR